MWQGLGQEGAAASPGGERAGTACQGFLHCPGDGAVGTCPVLALQLGYLLLFLLKATGHCSLIHLFWKACLLFSFLQVTMILVKTISQNLPLWKLQFFQMLELEFLLSDNIVPWFLQISKKVHGGAELWEHWAVSSFMFQFLYSWCLELFGFLNTF